MLDSEVQELADRVASMLLSYAAHGLATSSISGMGEISLRDGLVAAAAASGANQSRSWIIKREVQPQGWLDSAVDLYIKSKTSHGNIREVGGVELKWWRRDDAGNASNRRRDLVKDFIRAASLFSQVNDFAIVALLSTDVSWSKTTSTQGSDAQVMSLLSGSGSQRWNIKKMSSCKAIQGSVRYLKGKIEIPNAFHSKLRSEYSLSFSSGHLAFARVWTVKRVPNSRIIPEDELDVLGKS
ncbi:hypothetical protein BZG06_16260 [Salinivibrio kushneri]|uniref:hypothetical protein n=1 Tax=Salinivibrio kushneri TaxID=1908198 RepID=UPI0009883DCE|nr:hypothetical protein [Salinivibrio kushneri]OOE38426.1 hypothetical protein BZG06_16260 [Salinivibrio kushneri]